MNTEKYTLGLKDKNGIELPNECVIHGSLAGQTDKHYFNLFLNEEEGSVEMIACTYGYVHNVTLEDLINFEFVGLTKDNLHLLECD